MSNSSTNSKRPLSPHLQVYKLPLPPITSILHRITGVALTFGLVFLAIWLMSLAAGESTFTAVNAFMTSIVGKVVWVGFMLALFYHMGNGLRHLYWDSGRGFEMKSVYTSAYINIAATVILTVIVCIVAL
jgi:succinate dehydrogenase subunit C (EC 1.3.5.1)